MKTAKVRNIMVVHSKKITIGEKKSGLNVLLTTEKQSRFKKERFTN